MRRPAILYLAALVLLASSAPALAWNCEAHQLVGWIAEERLSEKAKAGVKELLGDANLSDAEVASWADHVRRERRESAPWHYVNIPVDSDGYDPARDAKGGDNVIDAIERFAKVLADRTAGRQKLAEYGDALNGKITAPREQRVEALKYLVHFVGDLHQPLHCADRNGDKGGNGRLVFFPGRKKAVSLHMVWDTLILPRSRARSRRRRGRRGRRRSGRWSRGASHATSFTAMSPRAVTRR